MKTLAQLNKNRLNRLHQVASFSSLLLGSLASAQGYYNGPRVDVNYINTPPSQYQECREKYINSTAKIFSACSFGVDEARRMAERFGGGKGRIEGYLRGFSWGLYKGVQMTQNDPTAQSVGSALNSDYLGRIDRAVKDGAARGDSIGASNGGSEARNRFHQALDSNMSPSASLDRVPEPSFSSNVSDPYAKYVGQAQSLDEMLKQPNADLSQIRVYSSYDATYLGDVPKFNLYDYWFADGTYRFEMAKWIDSQAAIQQWMNRPIDTKPQYEALGTDLVTVPVPSPSPGAPTTTQQTIDLKNIFKTSFVNAYAYYVNYYFSQNFFTNLDEGQRVGESIGKQVGLRYAQTSAEVKAFNEKFRRDERSAYFNVYEGAYRRAFTATYQDYASHPKPEIDSFEIIDEADDGIIQPGERFGVIFKVKNYGLPSTSIQAMVMGAQNQVASPAYSLPGLKSTMIRTPMIASMTSDVRSSALINLGLSVSGQGFNALTVQRTAQVIRQVTPIGLEITPSVPEGKATVAVTVKNNSRIASSSSVRITIEDASGKVLDQNLGIIAANQTSTATFNLSGYNPLDLIKGQGVAIRAQMFLGELAVDELTGTVFTRSPNTDLPNALALAAQDPTQQNNALALMNELVERIRVESSQMDRRGYADQPQGTYLYGALLSFRGRVQSVSAKETYSRLANQLWPFRKNFTNFLGIKSANRSWFENACRELNGGKKL
jgi:hypothetical protein